MKTRNWQQIRGNEIAMVLQDPRYALNPVKNVAQQVDEALSLHQKLSSSQRRERISGTGIPAVIRCDWTRLPMSQL